MVCSNELAGLGAPLLSSANQPRRVSRTSGRISVGYHDHASHTRSASDSTATR